MRHTFFVVLFICTSCVSYAQTYLYKRIMIVQNNQRRNVNDDAHFLTFNNIGCYESNSDGFSDSGCLIKYIKDENNLHCYYGSGYWGTAHYYFSDNYSRLNIKKDDFVFVYQRELNNKTTASYRSVKSNNDGNVIVPYNSGIISLPESSSSSHSAPKARYGERTCPQCHGTGDCSGCHGKGYIISIYTQEYTDCPNCVRGKCSTCGGNGKIYGIK